MALSRMAALALSALLPTAAQAACEPAFVDGSNTVRLDPPVSLDDAQLIETFVVRVRNSGDEPCVLRLGVGRDIPGGPRQFPTYSLNGPNGKVPVPSLSGAANNGGFGNEFTVPAGGQIAIPYDVRMKIGWGSEAGMFTEDLAFQLFDTRPERPVLTQMTQLLLEIPKVALIRFAGANGVGGPALINMGPLSTSGPTRSPPFALRILSTSGYRMNLTSDNSGSLRQAGGAYLIPYELSIGGKQLDLAGAGVPIQSTRHTSSVGDVHPVNIVVQPDPEYPAGEYSDRVTVTVTAI